MIFALVSGAIIISCCKEVDNSTPVEKSKIAWIAGDQDSTGYGMILFSPDAGETWVRQGEGLEILKGVNLNDIWAVDEDILWAIGTKNTIIRSVNGGAGWTRVEPLPSPSNTDFSSISIADGNNIWVSGSGGVVCNSPDGGNTWTLFDTSFFHHSLMQGICSITAEKIYVAGGIFGIGGGRGFVGYTLDGGATWDSVFPADDYNKNEWIGVAASGNTIVVYGGKSHYMVSIDGGLNWHNDSAFIGGGGGGADINHLIMLDPQTWWGAMDLGHVCYTSAGGGAWTFQSTNQGGYFLIGIDAWDSQLALVVGASANWPLTGSILKTSNGGALWETKYIYKSYLNKVSFIKE
jgi:photosystem II stability/assembly factor-like uncharacterized protein